MIGYIRVYCGAATHPHARAKAGSMRYYRTAKLRRTTRLGIFFIYFYLPFLLEGQQFFRKLGLGRLRLPKSRSCDDC